MIKVKSIMTHDVITISKESGIMDAAKLMVGKSVSCLVVVEKGQPVAIVSERDIIKGMVSGRKKVKEVMSSNFMRINPATKFSEVSRNLRDNKFRRFVVVENGKLAGLITETDIVEATRDFTRIDQVVQEVILGIFGLATAFFLFYFSPIGTSIFR